MQIHYGKGSVSVCNKRTEDITTHMEMVTCSHCLSMVRKNPLLMVDREDEECVKVEKTGWKHLLKNKKRKINQGGYVVDGDTCCYHGFYKNF